MRRQMVDINLPPGTIVQERYRIERLISQGGMGAVYQALDQRLGSTVALKQISIGDARTRKAFEREARLLAGLRHPVLPAVSDHFPEGTSQFLVMQFISGDDLGTLLDRNSSVFTSAEALSRVLKWADQLLDALSYLHSHTPPIVHRDIKPQNLKLTPRGELVLLDFGLAKGSVNPSLSSMSNRSLRAYTTQYAPLEQIQGTGTEPRSDLYALAATIYHMLTGDPPPNALMRAAEVLAGKPDPLQPAHKLNAHIPPALTTILHQAMAPGISKRFATASAMRTALHMVTQLSHEQPAAATQVVNSVGQQTIVVPSASTNESAPRLREVLDMANAHTEPGLITAPPTLIVSQDGQSRYQTVSAAVADALPRSRILVRPGRYQDSFVIDKELEIRGEGPREEIILESTANCVVSMQAESATLHGLTLRGLPHTASSTEVRAVVSIPQGRLALHDCDIVSEQHMGVVIHGTAAHPVLWRCAIHDSNGIGVLVYAQARATLEECDIFNHGHAGIAIRSGGNPTIRSCTIHHCQRDGIYVDKEGSGTIEECTISHNGQAGIEIKRGSSPFIRRCTIRQQESGYGILLREAGEGIIEECDILQNKRAGLAVLQGSNPLIRHCKIYQEQQRGVFFGDQAQGTMEQCEIVGNGRIGVEIQHESDPKLRQCHITRHSLVAIWVHKGGAGYIESCNLKGNARGSWHIEPGCKVLRSKNEEE